MHVATVLCWTALLLGPDFPATAAQQNGTGAVSQHITVTTEESPHSMTGQVGNLSSTFVSTPSMDRTQNDITSMSPTAPSQVSEQVTDGAQNITGVSEVLLTSTLSVTMTTSVLSTSHNTFDIGPTATHTESPTPTRPLTSSFDSQLSHHNTSSGSLQVSSSIPSSVGYQSTSQLSNISLDTRSMFNPTSVESIPHETSETRSEHLQSMSSTISYTGATVPVITSPVTEPSLQLQTSSVSDISTRAVEEDLNTISVSTLRTSSIDKDTSESLNRSSGPSLESTLKAALESSVLSAEGLSPPPSVSQYSSQSSDITISEETTVRSGSSLEPSGRTEGSEGGGAEGSSGGHDLTPGQRTALGFCLTVVCMALLFAGFVTYRRRAQVGRWKLLDKSLRYRYWSYTHDCQQEDDIL